MKVTLRRDSKGVLTIYVPKKDLEATVVEGCADALGGEIRLDNGWRLELPALADGTRLPITIEARRLDAA